MKIIIGIAILAILAILAGMFYLVSQDSNKNNPEMVQSLKSDYTDISVSELKQMLENKDFRLVDVHIPEQQHILNTDNMIAYNDVEKFISEFPNKNEKVVLYCRSGGMSRTLSQKLIFQGYTNIYNLEGGLNAWQSEGNPTAAIGSLD